MRLYDKSSSAISILETLTQMFQDLRKMTASQRSAIHGHVVDPLPNVPALVISLFPAHDMTKLFKLTIKLLLGRSAY